MWTSPGRGSTNGRSQDDRAFAAWKERTVHLNRDRDVGPTPESDHPCGETGQGEFPAAPENERYRFRFTSAAESGIL